MLFHPHCYLPTAKNVLAAVVLPTTAVKPVTEQAVIVFSVRSPAAAIAANSVKKTGYWLVPLTNVPHCLILPNGYIVTASNN